jgi:hypothetical protein
MDVENAVACVRNPKMNEDDDETNIITHHNQNDETKDEHNSTND